MNNDSPDSPSFALFDVDANPALNPPSSPSTTTSPPSRNSSTRSRSAQKRPALTRPIAWTRDRLPTLPVHFQRPIYLRLKQEILTGHLDGHVPDDQPLRLKVPIPGNGTRVRTFKQLVLQPVAGLDDKLSRLYAEVRREVTAATHGRLLTLEEALTPGSHPPRAMTGTLKPRRTVSGDGPDRSH